MRKEYYFIFALALFAGLLFSFGSRAGLALQAALRGSFSVQPPGSAGPGLTASLGISGSPNGMSVPVYSQYPLNLKNQLSIAAGSSDGVKVGDIALSEGHLVGIVEKTFERSALVQTIFDKRFQAPVRVGSAGADALLRGGNDPELTLIPADATVSEGEQVSAAAQGMPYGILIGSLRDLRDAGDKVFKQATVSVPYQAGSLKEVTIVPAFDQ